MNVELLDGKGVAALLKVDQRSARTIMGTESFPAPAIDHSQKTRRWLRSAVEEWVVRQHQKNNARRK